MSDTERWFETGQEPETVTISREHYRLMVEALRGVQHDADCLIGQALKGRG